jgi:hypothetical protein
MNIIQPSTKRNPSRTPSGTDRAAPGRYDHKVALLSSRFRLANGVLLRGRARLYGDRIELEGWRPTGRFKRRLPLVRIIEMNYHQLDATGNLSVLMDDGSELCLVVEEAHAWRQAFESWLNYHVLASAKIMQEGDQAASVAG